MRIFFYDETFEGLLSAVFDAYTRREFPDALLGRGQLAPLHAVETRMVESRAEKAERVLRGLRGRLSRPALARLLYAGLALAEGGGDEVFRYIRKVFDAPGAVEGDLADPDAAAVTRMARAVSHEKHRLTGFARFQKSAQGVYVAALEPRYDVLPLLVPHFTDRFRNQPWILYDAGRGYGIYWDMRECREIAMDGGAVENGGLRGDLAAADEALFQDLWKAYCAATVIRERLNPKQQRRCMPRRYWKYLVEKR